MGQRNCRLPQKFNKSSKMGNKPLIGNGDKLINIALQHSLLFLQWVKFRQHNEIRFSLCLYYLILVYMMIGAKQEGVIRCGSMWPCRLQTYSSSLKIVCGLLESRNAEALIKWDEGQSFVCNSRLKMKLALLTLLRSSSLN